MKIMAQVAIDMKTLLIAGTCVCSEGYMGLVVYFSSWMLSLSFDRVFSRCIAV